MQIPTYNNTKINFHRKPSPTKSPASQSGREQSWSMLPWCSTTLCQSDNVSLKDKAIIVGALGYLISPIDVIPDAIPIAGLTDDLSVLIYVINKVWNNVGDDVKQKAHEKLKTWFDEEELKAADDLFTNNPMDNPV